MLNTRGLRARAPVLVAVVAVLLAGAGVWLVAGAGGDVLRRHTVVDGVPLDVVRPATAAGRRPGVVVAHGFAGSARLMAPIGDTLAARGFVVVLLDFSGHGAHERGLPSDADAAEAARQRDLDVAVAHLRGLPGVDPARIALVGHSMGAGAVTRYAAGHPGITATVAISLPEASDVAPGRPERLLLLVGGLEFAGFRDAADEAARNGGDAVVVVPAVEHISILYAPRAHREIGRWLDGGGGVAPSPLRGVAGAGLLLLALLIGVYPLSRLLLGGVSGSWPPAVVPRFGRVLGVAAGAAAVAALVAPILPTTRLPLAVGGYVVGFTLVAGGVMLVWTRVRGAGSAASGGAAGRSGRVRVGVAVLVLVAYAAVAVAVPLHVGVTHAVPTGPRWWLLALVWAGFALLAYGSERLTGGNSVGLLAVSAVVTVALTGAALVGLAPGFVLLVVPLLAVLLAWQAVWSAVLHRFAVPYWAIALVGSLLVAWPVATALPVVV
ncbi:alpha/beta hydrolase [Cryptosporangium aurantiacum]|uniref:Serine aminopeptidase, S33 n=1 Tax=Cryptosporangium aurantiacum TaxID=134849 RepID=A0A1M7TTR2_9ACTN|nr:alpha/beta fold hydrolase [Cryptosporangium aurantiacum]SHN74122.1 Serine aminopeptidase, S33 [Cryptosporangium aurantiacum]